MVGAPSDAPCGAHRERSIQRSRQAHRATQSVVTGARSHCNRRRVRVDAAVALDFPLSTFRRARAATRCACRVKPADRILDVDGRCLVFATAAQPRSERRNDPVISHLQRPLAACPLRARGRISLCGAFRKRASARFFFALPHSTPLQVAMKARPTHSRQLGLLLQGSTRRADRRLNVNFLRCRPSTEDPRHASLYRHLTPLDHGVDR